MVAPFLPNNLLIKMFAPEIPERNQLNTSVDALKQSEWYKRDCSESQIRMNITVVLSDTKENLL